MNQPFIATGVVHEVPDDIQEALLSHPEIIDKWNNLTPLARNEWICWVTIVKKPETRTEHIERLCVDIADDKKRPCCWPGCPHRRPNAAKWF
ncbi:MAG: YdeI/OmpD-associated family protein [bacterium]